MPVVLVVEPQCFDASKVLEHLGGECMCIPVATPSSAACALHALQFDVVVVAGDKVEALDYAALFSTMRLVAPNARLVCGPAQASEHPARGHVQAAHENDPLRL